MRDYKTSRFIRTVGLSDRHYLFLISTRGKKSIAGRLEEIINFYEENRFKKYAKT